MEHPNINLCQPRHAQSKAAHRGTLANSPTKTHAYLIRNGRAVAMTTTAARNGDVVAYGFTELDGCIHQVGWAKISRAAKWECDMPYLDNAYVNYGGGDPI